LYSSLSPLADHRGTAANTAYQQPAAAKVVATLLEKPHAASTFGHRGSLGGGAGDVQ
jgi:hypothetical protein